MNIKRKEGRIEKIVKMEEEKEEIINNPIKEEKILLKTHPIPWPPV